jgi:hypothetical protein
MSLEGDFDAKVTIAKTYDRFFDGIEFDQLDPEDAPSIIVDTLNRESRVFEGTEIRP